MNGKRWFAIVAAVLIFAASTLVPSLTKKDDTLNPSESLKEFNSFRNLLNGKAPSLSENIIEEGDPTNRVAILSLNGTITSGSSSPLKSGGYDHSFFLESLKKVFDDPTVKAMLLVVNTPGGGVFESAEIRDKVLKIKNEKKIPVYVSMQNIAASGGYYISADADKIYANEETWTGSIGVIIQNMNYKGLMDKYGVVSHAITSGKNKAMASPYKEWSEDDQKILQSLVDESYDKFVSIVAGGRNLPTDKVKEIADGRIYSARQALENGLVDVIGNKDMALSSLMSDNGISGASVIEYRKSELSTFSSLFSSFSLLKDAAKSNLFSDLGAINQIMDSSRPKAYYMFGGI